MAKIGKRSLRNSVEKRSDLRLYFNRECECGNLINAKLLPDSFTAATFSDLYQECIRKLTFANVNLVKFSSKMNEFTDMDVQSLELDDLKVKMEELCEACGTCPNFISEKAIEKCSLCDTETESDDDDEHHTSDDEMQQPLSQTAAKRPKTESVANERKRTETLSANPKKILGKRPASASPKTVADNNNTVSGIASSTPSTNASSNKVKKGQLSTSVNRMDVSALIQKNEVALPPTTRSDDDEEENLDNEMASASHSLNANSTTAPNEYPIDMDSEPSSKPKVDKPHIAAHDLNKPNDIHLQTDSPTLVTIDHYKYSSVPSPSQDGSGNWSMAEPATPQARRQQITMAEDLVKILSTTPETTNAPDDATSESSNLQIADDENADDSDDIRANVNEDGSRIYEEVEEEEAAYVQVEPGAVYDIENVDKWTAEQVAQFVVSQDASLEYFAKPICEQNIEAEVVPLVTLEVAKGLVPRASIGLHLHFLLAIQVLQRLLRDKATAAGSAES